MVDNMKFLFIDTHYDLFIKNCYQDIPGLYQENYDTQIQYLLRQSFGTADFYTSNLTRLGHNAQKLIPNCHATQNQWLKEHGIMLSTPFNPNSPYPWQLSVLFEQIRYYRPDILYIHDLNWTHPKLLHAVRPYVKLIVGQNACPLKSDLDLSPYNLLLTSFPHYVEKFRSQGVASEYFRIGFGKTVLDRLGIIPQSYDTTFIGGYSAHHRRRIEFLDRIAQSLPVDFWGYGALSLPAHCAIRRRYHGEAWGLDMYRRLAASRITLNLHIDVAEDYANNMRLYEATGVGACLVTDAKQNLNDLFEVGKEVVAYTSPEDCIQKIRYLLDHEDERAAIAQAGQERTLREHTYFHRMQELVEIIQHHFKVHKTSSDINWVNQSSQANSIESLKHPRELNLKQERQRTTKVTCYETIKKNPSDKEAYMILGDFLQSGGKIHQAKRAYAKAQEIDKSTEP